MPPIPHGAEARALPPCDLVMKGGITSGIVYPPVVKVLAERYRFANIGGTSAGAIAAAVTAAAEYGRQLDNGGGIERLDAALEDLRQPGVLLGLFQPTPQNRPLFEVLFGARPRRDAGSVEAAEPASGRRRFWPLAKRVAAIVRIATRARSGTRLTAVLAAAALTALAVAAFDTLPAFVAVILAVAAVGVALLVVIAMAVLALGLLAWQTYRSLDTTDYGMCPGTNQEHRGEDALIDWLDKHIQYCAGRSPTDPPLTLGELRRQDITLTVMTTDLSFARPVRIPDDLGGYLFDPKELRGRFPKRVVDAMLTDAAKSDERSAARHQWIPTDDLPVLVAARFSLSFPILLSAMPLYLPNPVTACVARHVFSDGGISSNFPVQFFDAWFPGHPTFGIDLAGHAEGEPDSVFMPPDPVELLLPRLSEVGSLATFVANIIDTMQNWRDSLQSELPGFRDRICQIRMSAREGGLALNMDPKVVAHLIDLGDMAGQRILTTFDDQRWEDHQWIRYLTMMSQLQGNLQKAGKPFAVFGPALADGLPNVDFDIYRKGRGIQWCRSAGKATTDLVAQAGTWGPPPQCIDFCGEDLPTPLPVMRVVPVA